MHVGLIGTGNMGNRIGPRVLSAGHSLAVHDIRREAAVALCEAGARWADSPAAVAEASDVVITSLPSPEAVESVAFSDSAGLLAAMQPGSVYIDMSTSAPVLAREMTRVFAEKGIDALDAPLSSGGAFVTVGGSREAFDRCRPIFEAISEHVLYAGESGMGQVAKLVRQYISFSTFVVEAEALLICAKAGGDLKAVADFVGASVGRSSFRSQAVSGMFDRDFGTPGTATATLDIVAKDISLAVQLARDVGAPAQMGLVVSDVLQRAQAAGWGQYSYWAAVQVLEQMAGCELRPQ